MYICKLCGTQSKTYRGIGTHVSKSHKVELKKLEDEHNEIHTAARSRFYGKWVEEVVSSPSTPTSAAEGPQLEPKVEEEGRDSSPSPSDADSFLSACLGEDRSPIASPTPRLYEIPDNLLSVLEAWEQATPGVEAAQLVEVARAIHVENGAINEKVDGFCRLIKDVEGHGEIARKEAARLRARASSAEKFAKRLRNLLTAVMEIAVCPKIKTGLFRISLVTTPARIVSVDERMMPACFLELRPHIKRDEILQHFKKTGCEEGWFKIATRQTVRIS